LSVLVFLFIKAAGNFAVNLKGNSANKGNPFHFIETALINCADCQGKTFLHGLAGVSTKVNSKERILEIRRESKQLLQNCLANNI